jgi:site-specific recombinase XerC
MSIISRFLDSRGKNDVTGIDHPLITDFIRYLRTEVPGRLNPVGLCDATISRRLAVFSSFLDYTRATTLPDLRNPISEIRRKFRKQKTCKAVDDVILARLISGISVLRDQCLFALYLSTGLRVAELRSLNRTSIEFRSRTDNSGTEKLTGTGTVVGKGSKLRTFYVDGKTVPIVANYLVSRTDDLEPLFLSERSQRLSVRAVQYCLSSWCKRLDLPHIHPHQLRHSYAQKLANADIDALQLRALMGHEDFNTTLGYFKIEEQKIAQGYFAAMES